MSSRVTPSAVGGVLGGGDQCLIFAPRQDGVWVGIIPGLGSSVADRFAYGYAKQTCEGARESFGKGDVRGVIAVDAATNAKEGGSLIPTLAFGIPGSSTLALIFGGRRKVGKAGGVPEWAGANPC